MQSTSLVIFLGLHQSVVPEFRRKALSRQMLASMPRKRIRLYNPKGHPILKIADEIVAAARRLHLNKQAPVSFRPLTIFTMVMITLVD
ncbi:MAG TPA: hypothetical protein VFV38_41260 [Ktedonobacteraceae bacterium]|nr:hypothetical protein [Ktedonobacteraceae bacterium]